MAEIDLEITLKNTDAIFHTSTSRLKKQIAELELQKQTAHTNYLRNRLEHYIIRAPFPGIITSAKGKVGEIIQEYRTLIEISDPSELELQMKINVDEFHTLAVGQEAFVELVRDSWEPAKVIALTSRSQSTIPTLRKDEYIAHISLNHPKYELISNQRFPSKVITESRYQTLVIPAAGLREFRDRTYVRILEDEIRREVDVKVGIRTETQIEIQKDASRVPCNQGVLASPTTGGANNVINSLRHASDRVVTIGGEVNGAPSLTTGRSKAARL